MSSLLHLFPNKALQRGRWTNDNQNSTNQATNWSSSPLIRQCAHQAITCDQLQARLKTVSNESCVNPQCKTFLRICTRSGADRPSAKERAGSKLIGQSSTLLYSCLKTPKVQKMTAAFCPLYPKRHCSKRHCSLGPNQIQIRIILTSSTSRSIAAIYF